MAFDASKHTISSMIGSGFGVAGVGRAGKLLRFYLHGRRLTGTTVSIAGNKLGNLCSKLAVGKSRFRTLKSQAACRDPSTVRRWAWQLFILGVVLAVGLWQPTGWSIFGPSTILAWDWSAIRRILLLEANPP